MTLKELRISKKLTQVEASNFVGIPIRTYKNYENDISKDGTIKYSYIYSKLEEYGYIDETHGILTLEDIKSALYDILKDEDVDFCYMFGSYSRNEAVEDSDVDLLISTNITGMNFLGLCERIRERLNKKVDLLNIDQLINNKVLIENILRDGIKIYTKDQL